MAKTIEGMQRYRATGSTKPNVNGGTDSNNTNGGLYDGIHIEGNPTNQANADKLMEGVKEVLDDFGMGDAVKGIFYKNSIGTGRNDAVASMDGAGNLRIDNRSLADGEAGLDDGGYSISNTFRAVGAHEAGHAVVGELLKSNNVVINGGNPIAHPNLERSTARSKQKLEKAILKEAAKRYGSNPMISPYGSTKFAEKVAEAVADAYENGSNANPYSHVIVGVMKDINAGRFIPQIKVSRSEMGV